MDGELKQKRLTLTRDVEICPVFVWSRSDPIFRRSKINRSKDLFIFEDSRRKSVRRFGEEADCLRLAENRSRRGAGQGMVR